MNDFEKESSERLIANSKNSGLCEAASSFMFQSTQPKYSYNFFWQGRPIIQYPQDMIAVQEIVWKVRPDLIIETGIAHGGSLIMSASLLALLDLDDAILSQQKTIKPKESNRLVLGIDVDIRSHNRAAIEAHAMSSRIRMIEGSSTQEDVVSQVYAIAEKFSNVLVLLDSNHTHSHVLDELRTYSPLVSRGSYCVVFDTIIDQFPDDMYPDRPWGPNNSPKSAIDAFLSENKDFVIDEEIDQKLMISVAPKGYLFRP